jgi:hypothetical protein
MSTELEYNTSETYPDIDNTLNFMKYGDDLDTCAGLATKLAERE